MMPPLPPRNPLTVLGEFVAVISIFFLAWAGLWAAAIFGGPL